MGMIQIRNVPDDLHRTLKAKAAMAGMSLSDYMLDLSRRIADRPSWLEIREKLDRLPDPEPPVTSLTSVEIIRELRGPLPE